VEEDEEDLLLDASVRREQGDADAQRVAAEMAMGLDDDVDMDLTEPQQPPAQQEQHEQEQGTSQQLATGASFSSIYAATSCGYAGCIPHMAAASAQLTLLPLCQHHSCPCDQQPL
jgi:hypothetical protein